MLLIAEGRRELAGYCAQVRRFILAPGWAKVGAGGRGVARGGRESAGKMSLSIVEYVLVGLGRLLGAVTGCYRFSSWLSRSPRLYAVQSGALNVGAGVVERVWVWRALSGQDDGYEPLTGGERC